MAKPAAETLHGGVWPTMRHACFGAWAVAAAQMCAQLNNGVTLMVEPVKRVLDLTYLQMSYLGHS